VQQYRLVDYDNKGATRMITRDDPDFKKYYVDDHIDHIVSDFDQQMWDRITMTIVYDDDRKVQLPMGNMPIIYKATLNGQEVTLHTTNPWVPQAHHYVRQANIIYPVDASGDMIFTSADTPTIVDARSKIYNYAQEAAKLLEMAELIAAFASNIAMLGGYAAQLKSFTWVRGMTPPKPTFEKGTRPLPRVSGGSPPPSSGGKGPPPKGPPSGGGRPPGGGGPPDDGNGPKFTVIQGGRVGPPAYLVSLSRIQGYLQDQNAFQNGKPVFRTIQEFDHYWRDQQGFRRLRNDLFGYQGLKFPGRQLIYLGPDNTIVKVKTAGYSDGTRKGVATMSLEATNGEGVGWEHTLFKVDANGRIVAKNLHVDGEIMRLPMDHPGRKQNPPLEFGFLPAGQPLKSIKDGKEVYNLKGLTGLEFVQGGKGPAPDQQAWADRGHLDLPSGFDGTGAEGLDPDR
jgi:hypothetical protein